MLDLSRQYASIRPEILAAVERICDSQRYILSDEVAAFEHEFAAVCGAQHAVGCASGTDALWLALAAACIGPGHDVITTPFSFFATASAVTRTAAAPVFADIDPETLNLDPASVEKKFKHARSRMRAILPVHLYGQCADMDALNHIATQHRLVMIEDAAQAVGATWDGKLAGSMGLAGAFSFYPTKNLSAFGDAGALTTNDASLAEHMRSLRNHGSKQRYYHDEIGANSRLDAIQAAILRVKLKYVSDWNRKRSEKADGYQMLLKSAGLLTAKDASNQAPVRLLKRDPQAFH